MGDGEVRISPDILLSAYAQGLFPMAESANANELLWFDPTQRGILPLESFHLPKRLQRTIRQSRFDIRVDHDFAATIAACAAPAFGREGTWINHQIKSLYGALFERQHCHTVEVYDGGDLVGGLYGVAIGAAFFGESMFHRRTDASKIALAHLVGRLRRGGFSLLDTQFITAHLARFGAREVPRAHYHRLLKTAVTREADFYCLPTSTCSEDILQLVSQTS